MPPLKRVSFFNGQFLSADDFRAEQEYARDQRRRFLLARYGAGTVRGLQVASDAAEVTIAPGLAIDPLGRELILDEPFSLPFPAGWKAALLVLRLVEQPTDPMPATAEGAVEYSRVQEWCELDWAPLGGAGDGLILARFERGLEGWRRAGLTSIPWGWATAAAVGLVVLAGFGGTRRKHA